MPQYNLTNKCLNLDGLDSGKILWYPSAEFQEWCKENGCGLFYQMGWVVDIPDDLIAVAFLLKWS